VLTDATEVTVPVFDAKSMILDLATNPLTMNDSNIAAGYEVFTGNVDDSFPDNQLSAFGVVGRLKNASPMIASAFRTVFL
jgi:hypothetical protein